MIGSRSAETNSGEILRALYSCPVGLHFCVDPHSFVACLESVRLSRAVSLFVVWCPLPFSAGILRVALLSFSSFYAVLLEWLNLTLTWCVFCALSRQAYL